MSNCVRFASNIIYIRRIQNGAAAAHKKNNTIYKYIIRTDRDDDGDTRHLKRGPC